MDPTHQSAADQPSNEQIPDETACAEWLETDGRGGFAAGCLVTGASRRYHGLLVSAPPGTARRHVFLVGFLEEASWRGRSLSLPSVGTLGPSPACAFEARPWPRFTCSQGDVALERQVLMPRGRPATLVRYELKTPGTARRAASCDPWTLELRPVFAFRDADHLTIRNAVLRANVETVPGGIRCRLYDALPALTLTVSAGADPHWVFEPEPRWLEDVSYAADVARGYGGREDLFSPGRFTIQLGQRRAATIGATIEGSIRSPGALWREESRRRRRQTARPPQLFDRLARAADDFLYRDASDRTGVLAGFPWFGEWGRDTFIALPGLTLARGRLDLCADVLSGATAFLQDGLLPNIFGTEPEDSHYGSADASLWYARAVRLYDRAGGDETLLLDTYLPALREIATAYRAGAAPAVAALGIHADEAGLLFAGSLALNPTWMDAQVSSGPVTPRHGCAVELCALWCSLLGHLGELLERAGELEEASAWRAYAQRAEATFVERFVRPSGVLADVWRPDAVDTSVRPNMVLAAALEDSPLTPEQRRTILATAESELLTPYGLRTLSPQDPAYEPRYQGGPEERDRAYHQGTVWPWLLGFYCEASLRLDDSAENRRRLRTLWDVLGGELDRGGLEHLSEVYDGDPPQRGEGTFAQAWNTAEMLRSLALLDGTLHLGGARP